MDDKGLIDFAGTERPDPAVKTLLSQVGARIGPERMTPKERRAAANRRKKEQARKKSGLVRVTADIRPETKADVQLMAESLGVPVSQVIDVLLDWAMEMEREGVGPDLANLRQLNNVSRRYDYSLHRGTPQKIEGHPSENKGAPLEKSEGHPSKNRGAPLSSKNRV